MPYFLYDRPLETGLTLPFSGEEAHHLLQSRRIRPGERFALQGPDGLRFEAELLSVERRVATVKIGGPLPVPAQPRVRVVVLQAAVKEKAADWIVQKCTELGAAAIVFFPSQNAIVPRKALDAPGKRTRWEKLAWEACKQSGRQHPPSIGVTGGLEGVLADFPAGRNRRANPAGGDRAGNDTSRDSTGISTGGEAPQGWLLDPEGAIPGREAEAVLAGAMLAGSSAGSSAGAERPTVMILVGPEGGFTSGEAQATRSAGYLPVRLGENVLRAETAALAACTLALME